MQRAGKMKKQQAKFACCFLFSVMKKLLDFEGRKGDSIVLSAFVGHCDFSSTIEGRKG